MLIRRAVHDDIPAIMAIEQMPDYRVFIGLWSASEHLDTMSGPDAEYFVAVSDENKVDGFAILQGLASEHRCICLRRLAVCTPGLGIGRNLLAFVMERVFRDHGAHRLWLDVFETNVRARRLYETLGFREEGKLREAVLRDGEYHSQILMSLLDREYAAKRDSQLLF